MDNIIAVTEAEVKQWMAECDAGLHMLSASDEAALFRAHGNIMEWLDNLPKSFSE
jgi:predicted transcriptional regulator